MLDFQLPGKSPDYVYGGKPPSAGWLEFWLEHYTWAKIWAYKPSLQFKLTMGSISRVPQQPVSHSCKGLLNSGLFNYSTVIVAEVYNDSIIPERGLSPCRRPALFSRWATSGLADGTWAKFAGLQSGSQSAAAVRPKILRLGKVVGMILFEF